MNKMDEILEFLKDGPKEYSEFKAHIIAIGALQFLFEEHEALRNKLDTSDVKSVNGKIVGKVRLK